MRKVLTRLERTEITAREGAEVFFADGTSDGGVYISSTYVGRRVIVYREKSAYYEGGVPVGIDLVILEHGLITFVEHLFGPRGAGKDFALGITVPLDFLRFFGSLEVPTEVPAEELTEATEELLAV